MQIRSVNTDPKEIDFCKNISVWGIILQLLDVTKMMKLFRECNANVYITLASLSKCFKLIHQLQGKVFFFFEIFR